VIFFAVLLSALSRNESDGKGSQDCATLRKTFLTNQVTVILTCIDLCPFHTFLHHEPVDAGCKIFVVQGDLVLDFYAGVNVI
jgi:hypothetical protein